MPLPRVTEIIAAAGLMPKWNGGDPYAAMERGTAVHLATAYDDEGDLDEASITPEIWPYIEAYRRFRQESGVHILAIEREVRDETVGYVGHYDRLVRFNGADWVLDLKTGAPAPWHAIQLAAYRAAVGRMALKRGCLYLTPPSWKLVECNNRADWRIFLAALTLYQWRESCNLL